MSPRDTYLVLNVYEEGFRYPQHLSKYPFAISMDMFKDSHGKYNVKSIIFKLFDYVFDGHVVNFSVSRHFGIRLLE